jgi:hypothetical protein
MNIAARLALLGAGALIGAPGLAAPPKPSPSVWECKVERRIENGKTTMYDDKMRASPAERLIFVAETAGNRGCLLEPAPKGSCGVMFTGAAESGGMLRLDRMDEHNTLDLVNIFPSSGRFIRIHGQTQWMGKPGDCVATKGWKGKLP